MGKLQNLRGGGGVSIYTKVVVNVANHLEKAFMMVHDEECEGKNWEKRV